MLKLTGNELSVISKYVYDLSGIVIDKNKSYLVESRLGPIAEELKCKNYSELYFRARQDASKRIANKIVDAITTNETFFFRDNSPFELLRHKIFPDLIDRKMEGPQAAFPTMKIWSAACSTGQEVYSIAIILRELLGNEINKWRITLLGTDISDAAIAQASYGRYNKTEISRGLKPDQVKKYFEEHDTYARVKDEIRYMANFKRINLLEPFNFIGRFDIILCRNVAIYFSMEDRKKLFDRLADQLNPKGALLIGATETLFGISDRYERKNYMNSFFYQLKS
ncbi:MAG: protein-glutamate O-methyltransferase CheR [Calditrichaeota bacterium]|nr:MAG: protein-glutamate O-methyltransferase CheR [Calditrichota bacterium]